MAETKSGVEAAADRIRETAKWLTVSLAALGGVLLAGSQLSDIGSLELWSDRFNAALLGAALAAIGTLLIIWLAMWTAAAPAVGLRQLTTRPPSGVDDDILADKRLLDGRPSVNDFDEWVQAALDKRDQAFSDYENDQTKDKASAAALTDQRVVYLNAVAIELVRVASYAALARRWSVTRNGSVAAAIVAALGISIFVWASNPPDDVKSSVATPSVLSVPKTGTVILTPEGREALKSSLGSSCPTTTPISVLILGKTDAGPDLLVQQTGCTTTRFVAVPAWASVLGADD
jgi:hypothetical protein